MNRSAWASCSLTSSASQVNAANLKDIAGAWTVRLDNADRAVSSSAVRLPSAQGKVLRSSRNRSGVGVGMGVGVGSGVGTTAAGAGGVGEGVAVGTSVGVFIGSGVTVGVVVEEGIGVRVGVGVSVRASVGAGRTVGVADGWGVGVDPITSVGVGDSVGEGLGSVLGFEFVVAVGTGVAVGDVWVQPATVSAIATAVKTASLGVVPPVRLRPHVALVPPRRSSKRLPPLRVLPGFLGCSRSSVKTPSPASSQSLPYTRAMPSSTPRGTTPSCAWSIAPAVAFCSAFTMETGLPWYILPSQNWWQRLSKWVMVSTWNERTIIGRPTPPRRPLRKVFAERWLRWPESCPLGLGPDRG